jgi:hypothetical protein
MTFQRSIVGALEASDHELRGRHRSSHHSERCEVRGAASDPILWREALPQTRIDDCVKGESEEISRDGAEVIRYVGDGW